MRLRRIQPVPSGRNDSIAFETGHADVDEDQIGIVLGRERMKRNQGISRVDDEPGVFEECLQGLQHDLVVVENQNALRKYTSGWIFVSGVF